MCAVCNHLVCICTGWISIETLKKLSLDWSLSLKFVPCKNRKSDLPTEGRKVNFWPSIFKSQTVKFWSHHVLQTICLQSLSFHMPTCWPWHCGLYRAERSRKLCRNKTSSTFMARFDLVLRTELCRLSNRHCGKMPPDNQVLFICSVTECTLTVNQSRGRSFLSVHHCITERKMRTWERKWTQF